MLAMAEAGHASIRICKALAANRQEGAVFTRKRPKLGIKGDLAVLSTHALSVSHDDIAALEQAGADSECRSKASEFLSWT